MRTTWKAPQREHHGELTSRDLAFANIVKAAKHYDVEVNETDWRELGKPT